MTTTDPKFIEGDPPPSVRGTGHLWSQVRPALRARPGVWAEVQRVTPTTPEEGQEGNLSAERAPRHRGRRQDDRRRRRDLRTGDPMMQPRSPDGRWVPATQEHGTRAGYYQHRRRDEAPCTLCRAANATYHRTYRRGRDRD